MQRTTIYEVTSPNVYIYNMADVRTDNPNPAPKAQHLNCADRITNIMYKPRIAN